MFRLFRLFRSLYESFLRCDWKMGIIKPLNFILGRLFVLSQSLSYFLTYITSYWFLLNLLEDYLTQALLFTQCEGNQLSIERESESEISLELS